MKTIVSLIAGIIGILAGLLMLFINSGLFITVTLILALAGGITAVAIGNRAWNKSKDKIGLTGAILGIATWVLILIKVFTKFI